MCGRARAYLIQHEFPLPQHAYAKTAACYACAADRVGKYGEVCDVLFKKQEEWEKDGKVDQAACSVLTPAEAAKVRTLAKDPEILAQVQKDMDLGMKARLTFDADRDRHLQGQALPGGCSGKLLDLHAISRQPALSMRKYAILLLRLLIGAVFVYAAYTKLRDPWTLFAMSVDSYKVLPEWAVLVVARSLPWFELVLGLALIGGLALRHASAVAAGVADGVLRPDDHFLCARFDHRLRMFRPR